MEEDDRAQDLDEIRRTYASYGLEGRSRLWDLENPGYRRSVAERDARLADLLADSAADDRPTALLDVGCGAGGLIDVIERHDLPFSVTGLDLLPERIAVARERHSSAMFVVGSADEMPFGDASFDVAVAMTLFSSLPSTGLEVAVAREIARVVRPGGWLVWYDLRLRNPWNPRVHGLGEGRVMALFPDWESELASTGVPPPIARRLGRTAPVTYPVLSAIGPLRSHLVGRLRKPGGS